MEPPDAKAKILFLDDDTFIVNLYGMKFTQAGYELQSATSVKDALAVLHDGFIPDVIICDLVMAQASGFDFLNVVRAEGLAPEAYRIVLTNQGDDLDKAEAQSLGADRYIVKVTMIPDEVVAVVDEVIAHKKLGRK